MYPPKDYAVIMNPCAKAENIIIAHDAHNYDLDEIDPVFFS